MPTTTSRKRNNIAIDSSSVTDGQNIIQLCQQYGHAQSRKFRGWGVGLSFCRGKELLRGPKGRAQMVENEMNEN
jgi:hypothetical protein